MKDFIKNKLREGLNLKNEWDICDDFSINSFEELIYLINKVDVITPEQNSQIKKILKDLKISNDKLSNDLDNFNTIAHKISTILCTDKENLDEIKVSIGDDKNLAVIFIREDNIFLLIDTSNGEPKGYISFSLTHGDVYGIYGAYAEKGYGPLLYELVMTHVYPKGITMSDDSSTSDDAMNVWKKFADRADVEKKPINRVEKTDKEEWFDDISDYSDPKWLEMAIELHKTQFIYNLGKDRLNKLIVKGDLYLEKNPDIHPMDMVYNLEK